MLGRYVLLFVFATFCCAETFVAPRDLWNRQDAVETKLDTPTVLGRGSRAAQHKDASPGEAQKNHNGPQKVPPTATNARVAVTSPTKAKAHTNSTTSSNTNDQELPLQPSITPAVGIIGVVLMLTGLAYALIGIRHEWLLVFLSTAYLTSLGVTVLIIYVMQPPVSDVIQGAYFIAAFMTGVVLGGLSLVFREATRGFGCLLGGFCLAMWLLCLKSGGLITSTAGKAILISVFSAVGWSLAFSKYTRNYGTLAGTSFGGATVVILGVDCFSRAGLKEFWIYIWALNSQEFPLHTRTYPITRGMRAELACTVLLCVLGVVVQLKFWKVLKERKAKKEQERLQNESQRDERDLSVGRDVQQRQSRGLAAWEATYGNGSDMWGASTSQSSLKKSASVSEREVETYELEDMDASRNRGVRGKTSYATLKTDEPGAHSPSRSVSDWERPRSESSRVWENGADPNEPPIPPLPFSLLAAQNENKTRGTESKYTSASSEQSQDEEASGNLNQRDGDLSSIELPRIEDDRASSVAATLDEEPDMDALSVRRFSCGTSVHTARVVSMSREAPKLPSELPMPEEQPFEENDIEALFHPVTQEEPTEPVTPKVANVLSQKEPVSPIVELKDANLPRAISKVAHVYRTNEWAKHVADADQPEVLEEESLNAEEPAVHVDVGRTEETPRPVESKAVPSAELQPQFFKTASNPYRRDSNEQLRTRSSGTPIYSSQPNWSKASLNESRTSLIQSRAETRASSRQLVQPSSVRSSLDDRTHTPGNLLDERNKRLENRPTSVNFNGIMPPSSQRATSRFSNYPQIPENEQESDAPMSLARLPSQLNLTHRVSQPIFTQSTSYSRLSQHPPDQVQPPPTLQNWHSTAHLPTTAPQALLPDSHQPPRQTSAHLKQHALLAQWRTSLQQDALERPSLYTAQRKRESMIEAQRERDNAAQRVQAEQKVRQMSMDRAMRMGSLNERHREALRRMQAQVDRSAQ